MSAPPLKTDPKYGYFPWWPEDGDGWVHPEDVAAARGMIPRGRVSPKREMRVSEKLAYVFRRDGAEGDFVLMHYGDVRLRVRRTLWEEVEPEGLEIGDWVEVLSRGMLNEPRTGVVRETLWDERGRALRYQITEGDQPIEQFYAREDLQRVEQV
ncbi:MAG: hypothetical protein L0228_19900 [Planctomycetes bacterium]|nr:hypothetical protein [Planctomycetota bacterium]